MDNLKELFDQAAADSRSLNPIPFARAPAHQ
jgi:hypothetical protein